MKGASDVLMDVMSDIVRRAEQLAKDKIAKLSIAGQQMGPPTIANPPAVTAGQSSTATNKTGRNRKKMQQYADWDKKENMSSKDRCQKRVEARDEQRVQRHRWSQRRVNLLVYKQMVLELKTVLKTKKDRKMRKAIKAEIAANEDIIKTLLRSDVLDLPLPREIELQITVDRSKQSEQQAGAEILVNRRQQRKRLKSKREWKTLRRRKTEQRIEVIVMAKEGKKQMRRNQ